VLLVHKRIGVAKPHGTEYLTEADKGRRIILKGILRKYIVSM
jgi:hypothetical protein